MIDHVTILDSAAGDAKLGARSRLTLRQAMTQRGLSFLMTLAVACSLPAVQALAHDLTAAPAQPRNALPPETLQSIDLGKEIPGMTGRELRLRRVTLEPGGAILPHSHADRPAVVYILQGRVREHRSDSDSPVEYGAGDSMTESAALHHWIENISDEPLIGIVVDIPNMNEAAAFTAKQILDAYGKTQHVHGE